ncbi:hypothetical protein D9758_008294 [Tetrapyrgos nigripes]|uniref:F-box domain-containing protein n=1 Tax=Tetrapyrgos nigripes TaxID=182062 RepID=A0A8H5G1C3_9AGAR|nr:hypothetical protein D9758_008294 [Tetrapyrgos nigripes]
MDTGSPSLTPEIPQELVEKIIDYTHDSLPTLKSCSLVSHAWVSRARFHIFCDIVMAYPQRQGPFWTRDEYLEAQATIYRRLECLAHITSATRILPSMPQLTHNLVIDATIPEKVPELFPSLHPFRALRHLSIYDRRQPTDFAFPPEIFPDTPEGLNPEPLRSFLEKLPDLRSIKLRGLFILDVGTLFRVFQGIHLPQLKQLTLQCFDFYVHHAYDDSVTKLKECGHPIHPNRTKLEVLNLEVDVLRRQAFFKFLMHPTFPLDISALQTLVIAPIFDDLENYAPLFIHCGSSLSRLIISLTDLQAESVGTDAHSPACLGHLQNLKYLELWIVPSSQSAIDMMAAAVESFVPPLRLQIRGLSIGLHDWKGRGVLGDESILHHSYVSLDQALVKCVGATDTVDPESSQREIDIEVSSSFGLNVGQVLEWFPRMQADSGIPELGVVLFDEWYD